MKRSFNKIVFFLLLLTSLDFLYAQAAFEHHINRLALEVSENGSSLYRDNTILYPTWPYDSRYFNFSSKKMYIESWGVWLGARSFMGVGDTTAKDAFVGTPLC